MLRGSVRRVAAVAMASAALIGGSLYLGLGLAQATGTPYQVGITSPSPVPNLQLTGATVLIGTGTITVDIEASGGAPATTPTANSYSITLALGTNPTSATLACTNGTTLPAGTTGTVTFLGCTLNKTGSGFTLTASASGGPPSVFGFTSNPFNVSGTADHMAFTSGPVTGPEGVGQSINVSVLDSGGNVLLTDNSTVVTLTVQSGPVGGSLAGCTAGVTASAGVASFSGCNFNVAGTYVLTATATGTPLPTTTTVNSSSFQVTAPAKLSFTQGPVDGVVVPGQTITVAVEDIYGNVVTSDSTYTVTLAATSGPGSISCTPNPVLDSSGLATFVCTFSAAGTYTLQASATGPGPALSPITSAPFTIAASTTPSVLVFTQGPGNVGVNVGQTIQVSAEDGSGNVVTSDQTTVVSLQFQNNAGGGVLTCSATTPIGGVTMVNGVATFSGCSINAAGTAYTLLATATGSVLVPSTPTVISQSFSIFPLGYSVVTLPASAITSTSAVLNGSYPGGIGSTWDFEYGVTTALGTEIGPFTASTATSPLPVSVSVTGLTPNTTYYFSIFTSAGPGNTLSFFTSPTGSVVTGAATSITSTSATLNGTVNPGGTIQTCHYAYGTSSVLAGATSTASFNTSNVSTPVSEPVSVTGLTPNTTYYFELICTNGSGAILNFFTSSTGAVVTQEATSITSTSATLNGTVNPGGVAQTCSYGYGTSSVLAGATFTATFVTSTVSTAISEPVTITGLTSGTTYYFEFECTNGNGGILSFVAGTASQITQIYGSDPIGTSIAISLAEFPTAGSASAVVLARDDFFSDALAGGPLAAYVNGPLLLTEGAPQSASLDLRTQAEIQRVLPAGGTVYILGGNLAISPNVDATLSSLGYKVVREAGSNEYDTAYLIALQEGSPNVVFEATGTSFYDALSAVPAAIADHAAILLTYGPIQSFETGIYLLNHPGITRYAIGGPLAAYGADPSAIPVYGNDLYGTSAAVATTFFPFATLVGAATSATFTDALGGGVYMATGGRSGPLLIVNPSAPLPAEIVPYLNGLAPGTPGVVFGGPLAVGPDVLAALSAAVG